jgi:subtilase family serine protease
MRQLRVLTFLVVACALFSVPALRAQAPAPTVRIVDRIDENQLTKLVGNTHPLANARNDRGPVSPDLPMTGLVLVLSRSAEQQAAFEKFVASQYDSSSPNFHKWLKPEQVGEEFGPSESDIAVVTNWLTGHGFTIEALANDHMTIRFGGTAAQVESAFHTEIHNLDVKGEKHIANMSDPRIPTALTPVVVGVKSLHNFFPHPLHKTGGLVTYSSEKHGWQRIPESRASESKLNSTTKGFGAHPLFGTSDSVGDITEDVAPYDFATIYNVLPLWNASTAIDGKGQTIAIAGTSAICLSSTQTGCTQNDVATFRTAFGLPTSNAWNTPIQISGNSSPLTVCTNSTVPTYCNVDDQIENALDVEWSGAVAKNAQIELVSSFPTSATDDGLYDSQSYIISNSVAPIMNVSYGLCELGLGTAGNVTYYDLWQTAASEGIAVFVATGDSGAPACDQGLDQSYGVPYVAQYGLSVSGMASTPYNTAVGGTDLNWGTKASPYWGSTNSSTTQANAVGYMPEVPWNESCTNPILIAGISGSSGYMDTTYGYSGTNAEIICDLLGNYDDPNFYWTVDTVGGGGGKSSCVVNDGADSSSCVSTTVTTGASYGNITLHADGWLKPAWQSNVTGIPTDGVRDIPDVSFFASDGFLGSSYLICVSANGSCTYTGHSDAAPLEYQEVGGTSVASPAMAGVMALINQKIGTAQGNPNSELYALAAKQTYSSCSTETVTNSSACYFNDIDTGTIAMPCSAGAEPLTSPDCTATQSINGVLDNVGILPEYSAATGYDRATGLGSLNVANVVNGWTQTTGSATATVTVTPSVTSLYSSASMTVTAAVTGAGVAPTGTVTLTGGGYTSTAHALSSGSYTFTIPANSFTQFGAQTLTVSYSGDFAYAPNTGTTQVTVTAPSFTLSATNISLTAGASSGNASTVTVTPVGGYTGTVTLTAKVTASPSGAVGAPTLTGSAVTLSGVSAQTGTVTVSTTAADAVRGTHRAAHANRAGWFGAAGGSIVAAFLLFFIPGGTRRWRSMLGALLLVAALGFTAIGCGGGGGGGGTTKVTPTVTVSPAKSSISIGDTLSVPVTVTGTGGTPTGTVTLSSGSYNSSAQTLASGAYTFTIPANSLAGGTDTLTVAYSGDSNFNAASGTSSVTVSVPTTTGNYTVTVTGTGNDANATTVTTTFTLTVN